MLYFCGIFFTISFWLSIGVRRAKENEDEDIVDRKAKRVRQVVGSNEWGKDEEGERTKNEGSKGQPARPRRKITA